MLNSKEKKKRVVIIGGSFAGHRARYLLKKHFDVILVDKKGYFEFIPSVLRCLVKPQHAKTIIIAQPADVIVAKALSIKDHHVELSNGEVLEFDYCLICTGSNYTSPIQQHFKLTSTHEDRLKHLLESYEELRDSNSCVIVGGGTVGVELAAEIVGEWPNSKQVTLITSKDRLLERLPVYASQYATSWLESRGVKIILQERVSEWNADPNRPYKVIKTNKDNMIEADIVYKCIGYQPESEIINNSQSQLPISVDKYLKVVGMGDVFAAGDCIDTPEEKTAFNAELSATIAANNILSFDKGIPLLSYPADINHGSETLPMIINVSLHVSDGILVIQNVCITGFIAALMKYSVEYSQILMAKQWRSINYLMSKIEYLTLLGIKTFLKEREYS